MRRVVVVQGGLAHGDLHHHLLLTDPGPWHFTGEDLECEDSQGVAVTRRGPLSSAQHLRGDPLRGPDDAGVGLGALAHGYGGHGVSELRIRRGEAEVTYRRPAHTPTSTPREAERQGRIHKCDEVWDDVRKDKIK